MTPKLENKLRTKYSVLKIPCLDIHDGWYDLVDMLLSMTVSVNKILHDYDIKIEPTQIKQKYGSLRFYITHNWLVRSMDGDLTIVQQDEAFAIINNFVDEISKIEALSYKTCEYCGIYIPILTFSTRSKENWIVTLCDDCKLG